MNLQAVTQTRVQGDRRAVPGCAGLLSLGVQCRNGCKPVNAGHDNAGFNLATAVQQTVVHVLINLAQFQAHGARTAGAHELREAVEGTLLRKSGQGCRALNGLAQDDGFGNQFSFVFAELLLGFLQLSGGFLSGFFTGSRGSLVLLGFLLVDALCSQCDALGVALLCLLIRVFALESSRSSNRSSGCRNSGGKRDTRSCRGTLGGLVVRRVGVFRFLRCRVLNLGSGCYRLGGYLFGLFHSGFFRCAFFNSGSIKN